MKSTIKIIDGKVCLIQEVTKNENLHTHCRELQFDVQTMLDAVIARMKHCMEALQVAVEKQLIMEVGEHNVLYIDENQSVRGFNINSYQAMEGIVTILQSLIKEEAAYIPMDTVDNLFTLHQVAQLKRAMATHFQGWTDSITALDEIEYRKWQQLP